MGNFRLMFALLLICSVLVLAATVGHYRQLAQRWQEEAQRTTEISRRQASELTRIENLQRDLATLDQHHTEKLNAARQENDSLRAELASDARRMHIAAARPRTENHGGEPASRRMGDDAAVELSAATGQRILSVREGIVSDQQKLIYLQEYIRRVCLN